MAKKLLSKNIIGSGIVIIITLIAMYGALKVPMGTIQKPEPGFFPTYVCILLLIICAYAIVKELLFPPKQQIEEIDLWDEDGGGADGESNMKAVIIVSVLLILYLFLLPILGYMISTLLMMFALLRVYQYKNWWISIIVAIIVTGLSYLIFHVWFGTLLPTGLWI